MKKDCFGSLFCCHVDTGVTGSYLAYLLIRLFLEGEVFLSRFYHSSVSVLWEGLKEIDLNNIVKC